MLQIFHMQILGMYAPCESTLNPTIRHTLFHTMRLPVASYLATVHTSDSVPSYYVLYHSGVLWAAQNNYQRVIIVTIAY